jgi:hypothetical protein
MFDRGWAVGLNQGEFEIQYLRKFPGADVIPTAESYVAGSEPVYHGIDGVKPEDLITDSKEPSTKMEPEKKKGRLDCSGCGRVFTKVIARAGHERHCKAILAHK